MIDTEEINSMNSCVSKLVAKRFSIHNLVVDCEQLREDGFNEFWLRLDQIIERFDGCLTRLLVMLDELNAFWKNDSEHTLELLDQIFILDWDQEDG